MDDSLPARADENNGQVAIKAAWGASGASVAAQSRAISAFDSLVGSAIGIPKAYIDGLRARVELRNDIKEAMIRVEGRSSLQILQGYGELGQMAANTFIRDQVRKQSNREAVWVATEDATKLLSSQSENTQISPEDDQEVIDEDWLNLFSRHAEDASSNKLRSLWGRILAGKIRAPGSFSLSTMRVIAEMDSDIARAFEEIVRLSIGDMLIKPRIFRGEFFKTCKFLEEVGLLYGVDGNMNREFICQLTPPVALIAGSEYGLELSLKEGHDRIRLAVMVMTRAGTQIASILERDEVTALREAVSRIDHADRITLVKFDVRHRDGSVTYCEFETLLGVPKSEI